MKEEVVKRIRKLRRMTRTRKKIIIGNKPRLTVFRSNKYIYAQIIDDSKGKTLVAASEKEVNGEKMTKAQIAEEIGNLIAQRGQKVKVKEIVFDKGGYKYHGRVKAVAEGARKGGLVF